MSALGNSSATGKSSGQRSLSGILVTIWFETAGNNFTALLAYELTGSRVLRNCNNIQCN